MGTSYPLAGAHNNGGDTAMPIEQGGNMLIMTLSYTQQTGDHSIITSYTGLLDQWTQILIGESLVPGGQVSGDDFIAGSLANQTNLAIKGITGIKAMSVIYGLLNNFSSIAKSRNYSSIASSYVSQFMKLGGISSAAHLTLDASLLITMIYHELTVCACSTMNEPPGVRHTICGRIST
jgi:hypothetical protein